LPLAPHLPYWYNGETMTITDEEKAAKKLVEILSDIRTDLHLVGYYFANLASRGMFIRLEEIQASAQEVVDDSNDREKHYNHLITFGKD
jgi:hypothetical protein